MANSYATSDAEIRAALHRRHLRHQHSQARTLIVDELGLAHAQSRIDIAVINGCIHGYEIKSSRDNLARLSSQLKVYRKTLQKLTFVTASNHLSKVLWEIPAWCGVVNADKGPRGGINFRSIRPAKNNPNVDPSSIASDCLAFPHRRHILRCIRRRSKRSAP